MPSRTNRSAYVVLGLLADGPLSGYDIKRAIDDVTSHFWRESYGQIYPVLAQLMRQRLVTRKRAGRGARPRFEYTLTAAGRAALRAWLLESPEPESVRHELLLKLFFGKAAPASVLASHIRAFRARNQAFHATLVDGCRELEAESGSSQHLRLTMLNGVYVTEARVRWADEALAELERMPKTAPVGRRRA
jgi:DNA-binding PadR family transcriptional regulator